MLKNKQIVGKALLKMEKRLKLQKRRSFSSSHSVTILSAFKNLKPQDFSSKFFKSKYCSIKKKKCNIFFEAQALNFYSSHFYSFSSVFPELLPLKERTVNFKSKVQKSYRSRIIFNNLISASLKALRSEASCYSLLLRKKRSIVNKHAGFSFLRNSTIDWHCTKPLAQNQLGLWFSFMVQPFSTRKHWWILLPSQNLLFRLRWETLGKQESQAPGFYSFKDFVESNNVNIAHLNWFSEKPFYFYVIVPFLGCLGLIYASLNSYGPTQKTSQTLLNPQVSSNIERLGQFFSATLEKKLDFFSDVDFNPIFEDKMSWETLNYLNYKKNLLDMSFKHLQKTNLYHDKIVYELSSTWFNYVQENYIGTYAKTSCYDNYLNSSNLFQNLPLFLFSKEKDANSSFLKEKSSNIDSFLTSAVSKKTIFDSKSSFDIGEFISERFLLKKNKGKEKNSFIKPLQSQIFKFWWTQKNLSQIYSTMNSNSKSFEKTRLILPVEKRGLKPSFFLLENLQKSEAFFLENNKKSPQLKFTSFNVLRTGFPVGKTSSEKLFSGNLQFQENTKFKKQKKLNFFFKGVFKNSVYEKQAPFPHFSIWQNYLSQKSKIQWFWYKWCLNDFPRGQDKTSRNLWEKVVGHLNYKIHLLSFFSATLEKKSKTLVQRNTSSIQNTKIKNLFFNDEFAQKLFSGNLSVPKNYLSPIQTQNLKMEEKNVVFSTNFSSPFDSAQLNKNAIIKLDNHYSFNLKKFNTYKKDKWDAFINTDVPLNRTPSILKEFSEKRFSSLPSNFCFDSLILINGLKSKTNNMKQLSFALKKDFKTKKIETKPVEFYRLFGRFYFKNNLNYLSGSKEFVQKNPISLFSEEENIASFSSLSSKLYSFQSFSDYFTAAFFFDNIFYKFFLDNKKVNFLKSKSLFLSKNNNKMGLNSTIKTDESRSSQFSTIFSPKKLNFPILLSGYFFPLKKKECSSEANVKIPGTLKKSSVQVEIPIPPYFLYWKKDKNTNTFSSIQKNSFTNVFLVPKQNENKEEALLLEKRKKNFQNQQEIKLAKASFVFPTLINNFMHPDRQKSTSQSNKLKWKSLGKWSFYWNYFYHFYGSSSFFKPWSSMFDSTNSNKHSQIFFKQILSPFSGLNNLTGQNIFFKKWHSKKKEGFFYKRITKLEFKNPDLNAAKYSRVVSLLWGFRSKYKLDEVLQYQKSKYYQSKKAQQTANQNIDQNSTDSKINKQIVIKTLNKRRRYKRYLELDVVSSWLRDILYFRKMCRKLVPIKKDSYLFTVNTINQNSDFLKEKKAEWLFFSTAAKLKSKDAVEKKRWHLMFKKRKNSFFNILERNHECVPVKKKAKLFFLEKSDNTSKKLFLSLNKFIRVKNLYKTGYSPVKKNGLKKRSTLFKIPRDYKKLKVENLRDNSKFINKIEINNYSYFSNSLLFNSTPVSLKKICLNFSNKRLLKINWKKKLIQKQKSGEFRTIKKVNANFSFDELFSSIFKNLNRFFIFIKKTISRQLFLQVQNLFYSGKNSFLVKKGGEKRRFSLFPSLSFSKRSSEKSKKPIPSLLHLPIKPSSHIFDNQTKLTNRIRLNKFWGKQDNGAKIKQKTEYMAKNNCISFNNLTGKRSSVSNLIKININRSFSKKVSTFSTTVSQPSSLSFNFSSERKFSGNFDFLFYRKNKTFFVSFFDKKRSGKTDRGLKYRSFEELMTKFKNLSASFVIWRNKFQIRRDYLLLSYIYLDYLGALVNSFNSSDLVLKNSIFSNVSLINFLSGNLEWQKISSPALRKNLLNKSKKMSTSEESERKPMFFSSFSFSDFSLNLFNYLEIFKNEENYLLSAQHYKSNCLKPVWSFSIVNHLKLNHLAVYEQLTNFSEELKQETKNLREEKKLKKGNSLRKEGEKTEEAFFDFPFFPKKKKGKKTELFSQVSSEARLLKKPSQLSPIFDISQSSFPQFSQSLGGEDLVFHRSIKNSKDFVKRVLSPSSEGLLLPFRDSATYNKKYLDHKNNILKRKLVLLKNQQKYLFAVNFLKNKAKYRRKSGIYNSRIVNKQTKIYNGLFLSNSQVGLKNNELILSKKINFSQVKILTFWLCTLLFHVCLISSLLTSYKSSIHFCIKTLYSSLFVLNKYFVYTKYRIKRLINYIYQNNFEYLIETTSKYFSLFKTSHVNIFNSLKFPDSFIQLDSLKENITRKNSSNGQLAFTHLNKSSLDRRKSSPKNEIKGRLFSFYFSSFSSKILALFQYVQYKYQTPLATKLNFFGSFFLQKKEVEKTKNENLTFFSSLKNKVKLKNFQRDPKISTLMSPFWFSLLKSNKESSSNSFSSDVSSKLNLNLLEKNQLNLLKTNLTEKLEADEERKKRSFFLLPSKEKNLKVYFKVLQWNMLITLLIGESEVLAELEPYREMHWYFLKKFPIFLRTSSGKDYLSMSDYQADEKIRIIKQKIRQTIMILYLRSRKYESKLQSRGNSSFSGEKKTTHLLKTRLNQKNQKNASSMKVQKQMGKENELNALKEFSESENKNSGLKKGSLFLKLPSIQKLVKTVFNFFYSLSIFSKEKKKRRQKIKKLSAWKSILTFLGKYSFVTRSAILNKRFRESVMLFSQPLVSFGPIGTIFIPYGIKNFLLRFDQIDYQRQKTTNTDFFKEGLSPRSGASTLSPFFQNKKEKMTTVPVYMKQKKLEDFSQSSYLEKVNFYIMRKLNKEFTLESDSFPILRSEKTSKNSVFASPLLNKKKLFRELDSSPLFDLGFLTNLQKLIKKYNRVYYGFNDMKIGFSSKKKEGLSLFFATRELGKIKNLALFPFNKNLELTSTIDSSDYSSFLKGIRNLSVFGTKNMKTIITESNLYDWTYNDSSNRLGKNSMYFDTFDPKLRYYRFSTNFSKVLSDVGGLYTNFSAHQELGPLICKVYTGLFSNDKKASAKALAFKAAKNYLLVSGPSNNESVLFLVQALAAEIGMKLFMEDAKRLQRIGRRGINKATKRLEKLFDIAQANVPALVFIEDIHVIGSKTKMVKVDEEQDDVEILARSLLSKLVYRKYHKNKSLREAFIDQNLLTGGSAVLRRRSLKPTNPIPKSLVLYQLTRRRAYSNFFKSQDNASRKISTKLFLTKKLSPAFTTNAVLIWKLFKSKIATPNKRIKESPWFHIPVDAMRSIHPLTYSIRVKVAKITLLAIFTMGTRLRLVKDLIRLFEKTHYNSHQNFIVFATTNKLATLDPSLRRPGRLEEIISLYSLTGVSTSSRSPAFMSVLDTFKVYLKNVPGFSKTFNLIDNTLFSSTLNLKEWSLINYLAESSYYSFYSSKNSFESNSLNTVDFFQKLLEKKETCGKRELKKGTKKLSFLPLIDKTQFSQKLEIKRSFPSKTVTPRQLKKQRMTSFETKSKVNAAFSSGNLFTSQNSHSSNNSDYWQLIFSNITLQRKKGGFDFSHSFTRFNQDYSKNKTIYFNKIQYKKYNKSNLFITLAYSRSGQSLISFLLNYKKENSRPFEEQKILTSNRSFLFFDSDYLTNLQLWPETVNINSLKPQNTFYNRRKNLQSYFLRFFSSKVGELLFTNSIVWNLGASATSLEKANALTDPTGKDSKNYILDQGGKVGALVPGFSSFLNNIYGITPDWTCAYSYIKNVVTTSSLYSKTPLISKLLRLEDVSKPRQKQFFESLNAGMLFEYFDFHYRAFFKKNNLSTEENLNLLISQKYMLNNQGRPLRKYVKLENSNRLWLFRVLYTELGTLDNISLRPTSMNYYYRNKIILKQSLKLSSYQWWNWHLRKPLEQLEDVQEIAYFPCENKYYNPRHRRWILTNGFWGYWFSFDKNFYFDLYEQSMFQSFHIAYLHLDQNREILDYLSKLYICREKLSETDLILSLKRYKI